MLYYLIVLVISSAFFGNLGFLSYEFKDLLLSTTVVLVVGYISNYLFSKIFKAETNIESVFITGLILVLIMPVGFPKDTLFLGFASSIAMASKYILAINKRHIFNPAAISAVIMSTFFGYSASWWVGSLVMFPLIFTGGLLILRKTQREKLIAVFVGVFLLIVGLGTFFTTRSLETVLTAWQVSILESSLPFFAFVMLIEPQTTPTRNVLQLFYAVLVSIFYTLPQVGILVFITSEMALCIGNIFSYIINPNYRLILFLNERLKQSKDTYSFIFEKQKNFNFIPGQYMEWTLPHKNADSRGNRRYFSLSSSPTEQKISITVKFYDNSSTYKKELLNSHNKKRIIASQVSGDFVLPNNLSQPMVFIAGGVGITPFRSMIKYIVDKNLKTDIVLIYSNRTKDEILFSDIFKLAENNGVKTIYCLTDQQNIPKNWQGIEGHLSNEKIKEVIPDYKKRIYYISGPQLMVRNFEKMLIDMGISKNRIKEDFFPGYLET
jgi:ferredoxin-NADP reductase/Na+-translocating ferredoxin:NAD+ oxidoreductase RnfD subunit